ncbi:MAG TPA: NrsF family protein [Polyangiaceae bacterium]|nr:NrsF family protein [Polyangiaceae bacterium]
MAESKPPTSEVKLGLAEAQLRAQVLEMSALERAPTRAQLARQHRIVLGVVLLVPLLIFAASGGIRLGPRPERLVLQTALGSAFLAAGLAIVGIGRGRSMLGRPRWWLLAQVLLTPVLLFGWRVLVSAYYPNMMGQWVDRPGFRCFTLSVILAFVPLLGLLWLRRGSDPLHPRLTGAAFGAAVGAGSWVLVDLWCPVSYIPHLLLGHVLPLLLSIALSALLGSRVIALGKGSPKPPRR